jgi:acyl-CoA thioesterase
MTSTEIARAVIDKMYFNDPYSKWLGIERIDEGEGFCVLKMIVRPEMLNGFSIAHGGITYSLADSALAFASNSHGMMSVSVETSISHLSQVKEGDILIAKAKEIKRSKKIGLYEVHVYNQSDELVAHFKGTVYRTNENWLPDQDIK